MREIILDESRESSDWIHKVIADNPDNEPGEKIEKAKVYLQAGEVPPKGQVVKIGPRRGRFYDTEETTEKRKESPFESPIERTLKTGKISSVKHLGGGCNETKKIIYENGELGVFKPMEGEGYLRDTVKQGTFYLREVAAYQLCKFLGWDYCPETVIRKHKGRIGSIQKFVENAREGWIDNLTLEDIENMAFYNMVMGNTDRHGGNWLVTKDNKPIAIDHGLAFPDTESAGDWSEFTSVFVNRLFRMKPNKIPKRLLEKANDILNRKKELTKILREHLDSTSVELMFKRVRKIIENEKFTDPNLIEK